MIAEGPEQGVTQCLHGTGPAEFPDKVFLQVPRSREGKGKGVFNKSANIPSVPGFVLHRIVRLPAAGQHYQHTKNENCFIHIYYMGHDDDSVHYDLIEGKYFFEKFSRMR